MSPFHSTPSHPHQPNLVVGWASGLVQVWPAEDTTIAAPEAERHGDVRREQQRIAS
jgi:hypothetical protein